MAKKLKKFLKKAGKAAAVAAALYGATKLGKNRRASKLTEGDIGIGQRAPRVDDYNYIPKPKVTPSVDEGIWGSPWGAKGGGIAKRGMGAAFKSGGRVKSMGIAKRGGGVAKR